MKQRRMKSVVQTEPGRLWVHLSSSLSSAKGKVHDGMLRHTFALAWPSVETSNTHDLSDIFHFRV